MGCRDGADALRDVFGLLESQLQPRGEAPHRCCPLLAHRVPRGPPVVPQCGEGGLRRERGQRALVLRVELQQQSMDLVPESGRLGQRRFSLYREQVKDRGLILRGDRGERVTLSMDERGHRAGIQPVALIGPTRAQTARAVHRVFTS